MNYKIILPNLLFSFLLIIGCSASKKDTTKPSPKGTPNIVLILSDDQSWTDYSFMGHEHIQTPNIDKLANEGLTFIQAYVPTSLCSPSLASIITGLYPRQHMVLGNDRVLPGNEKKDKAIWRAKNFEPVIDHFKTLNTLPKILSEKGYLSFQTGKWWLGNYKNGGFDVGMTHGDPERKGRHGDYGLQIGRKGMDTLYNYIDLAVEEKKPFFMWYAPYLPHRPHTPPDSLFQKYASKTTSEYEAKYWAMCEWFDITCGQLMDYIDDIGQTDNTLFVYVCDNGWVQNVDNPSYNKISKRAPYDLGIRTPIIYKWTGQIKPKRETNLLASSIDIVPTILNILDIDQPEEMDGIDVLDPKQFENRKAVFGEIYSHDFSTLDKSIFYKMAISNPYKLIVPDGNNKPDEKVQLYDIIKDPFEQVNLANDKPKEVSDLKNMIDDSWRQQ